MQKKNGKFGKNISKNFSSKYSQKLLDHAKQSATYPHKTAPKSEIQKTAEATADLIGNKSAKSHPKILQRQLKVKQKHQKKYKLILI